MTPKEIFALICTAAILFLGALIGRPLGKAEGRKEGAAEEKAATQSQQNKAGADAAKERTRVEIDVARAADADIDQRLSKHSRPD